MKRKIALPILYFLFGVLVYIIESTITLPHDLDGTSYNSVNSFNKGFFIGIPTALLLFNVIPQFIKISSLKVKCFYLITTSILLIIISFYWIQVLVWD